MTATNWTATATKADKGDDAAAEQVHNEALRLGIPLADIENAANWTEVGRMIAGKKVGSKLGLKVKDAGASGRHLIIEARAGTGKTTTLVEGLKRLMGVASDHPAARNPSPQQRAVWEALEESKGKAKTICFAAFNSAIAKELQERVPQGCVAMTMHSMGYRAIRDCFGGKVGVDEHRTDKIIGEVTGADVWDLRKDKPGFVEATKKLVDLCKMNLTDYSEREELVKLCSHYEVELEGYTDEIFALVPKVMERCKDVGRDMTVHFSDMIWLPVALKLAVQRYDLLLVDEAQDLNRCQQALAKMAGKRLILCGDPKQAIYGFAGADSESMNRMFAELPDCVKLPLTVTRRCGKAIVQEANKIVVDFHAFETNGEGKVSTGSFDRSAANYYAKSVQSGDMILCRVNAPLVSECFRFIKEGRAANIQGRDIAQGIISTITKLMKGKDINLPGTVTELVEKLSVWLHKETEKEQAKKFPSEARIIGLQDKHDCIFCFTEGVDTVAEVIRKVESVFVDRKGSDRKSGILLSSIHKAKGLEAHRVFLLEPKGATCPHPMATSDWQKEQEWNLRYVAITRAIEELVFVS